jgi:hypothetical protein
MLCLAALASPVPQDAGVDRKAKLLKETGEKLEASNDPFFGRGMLKELERRVASLPPDAPVQAALPLRLSLGDSLLQFGQIDRAIEEYEKSLELTKPIKDPRTALVVKRKLAVAWMRQGERQNCVTRHNQDSCILPLKDGALHVDRTGSQNAIALLQDVIAADGGDLRAIWLLNVAHMTLGTWPDGVAPPWRIPASAFRSEHEMPRMLDVAPQLGLASPALAGSAIADDFDGDGELEILTSSWDVRTPMCLYRRQADGSWADVGEKLGLKTQVGAFGVQHFDANNDGRLDLIAQRGGWLGENGQLPNSLLIQQPDGAFVDRTLEAGIEILAPSQVAAPADYDLDGDLDLFLGYENVGSEQTARFPCKLFRNRGDATFEDVTIEAGVQNLRPCKGAAWGDYDGDGRPDLYVSNMHAANRLYHNEGNGRFKDVAAELGVQDPLDSFACWFFDCDDDGWLDLFVTSYDQHDRGTAIGAYYRNHATGYDTQRLYLNDGHGRFRDATVECRLDRVAFTMGSNFGDVDNDGFPDLYLATGDPELASIWPNLMLRNGDDGKGGRRFEDVTTATGTGHLQKGHGVAFADLDGDGDQDLFVKLGGAVADDGFASVLFENPGHGHRWINVRLRGVKSNRFGVGARIKVTIQERGDEAGKPRDVFHFVGANSSFGGNSLQAEIGLGNASRIVALEVTWPGAKEPQRFPAAPLDRIVVVEEGNEKLVALPPAEPRPLTVKNVPGR